MALSSYMPKTEYDSDAILASMFEIGAEKGFIVDKNNTPIIPEIVYRSSDVVSKVVNNMEKMVLNGVISRDLKEKLTFIWSAYCGIGAVKRWDIDWEELKMIGIVEFLSSSNGFEGIDDYVLESIRTSDDDHSIQLIKNHIEQLWDEILLLISKADSSEKEKRQNNSFIAAFKYGMTIQMYRMGFYNKATDHKIVDCSKAMSPIKLVDDRAILPYKKEVAKNEIDNIQPQNSISSVQEVKTPGLYLKGSNILSETCKYDTSNVENEEHDKNYKYDTLDNILKLAPKASKAISSQNGLAGLIIEAAVNSANNKEQVLLRLTEKEIIRIYDLGLSKKLQLNVDFDKAVEKELGKYFAKKNKSMASALINTITENKSERFDEIEKYKKDGYYGAVLKDFKEADSYMNDFVRVGKIFIFGKRFGIARISNIRSVFQAVYNKHFGEVARRLQVFEVGSSQSKMIAEMWEGGRADAEFTNIVQKLLMINPNIIVGFEGDRYHRTNK